MNTAPQIVPHYTAKRYLSLIGGIISQLCLGGLYAFSAFVPRMTADWGIRTTSTQILFGGVIFLFTFLMIITGRLLRKFGPRILVVGSGMLFFAGYTLASLGGTHPALLFIGYLGLVGIALAAGYVSPISTGLLWFPHNRGMITGIAIAGYGAGGVIQTAVVEKLFSEGYSLQQVMSTIGLGWGICIVIGGLLSFTPPGLIITKHRKGSYSSPVKQISAHKKDFAAIGTILLFGTLPGLMLIGQIKPIGLSFGFTPAAAAAAVSILAVGNGLGRILWGVAADHFTPRVTALANLAGVLLSIAVTALIPSLFLISSFLIGFMYGGPLVIAPDQTARRFGPYEVGTVYPFALTLHGIAAIFGAPLSGYLFEISGSYQGPFLAAGVLSILGFLLYQLLTVRK